MASAQGYRRQHLTVEQVTHLYGQALQQTEAAVVNAWINWILNPGDVAARAGYDQAAERLRLLEEDRERCLRSE